METRARRLLLTDEAGPRDSGAHPARHAPRRNHTAPSHVSHEVEEGRLCWLVGLPAVDGKQYVYRVYAPSDALPADLFWDAWHCHDESPFPRAWDLFDAAVIRRVPA